MENILLLVKILLLAAVCIGTVLCMFRYSEHKN